MNKKFSASFIPKVGARLEHRTTHEHLLEAENSSGAINSRINEMITAEHEVLYIKAMTNKGERRSP